MKIKLSNEYYKKIIESIIFVSDKPVKVEALKGYFKDLQPSELKEILDELVQEWDKLNRGFKLELVSGGYHFRTRSDLSTEIIEYNKEIKKFRLSRAALEVLAITAYKQPLTRIDVDQIRGVDSSGVLNLLLDKRLIEIKGRKDVPGRPFLYITTEEFLETFGLNSLKDLPSLKELEEISKDIGELL